LISCVHFIQENREWAGSFYSYVIRHDNGAAPNPFWGLCTLTICKPDIRRTSNIPDWVIGTGSKNSRLEDGKTYDFSDSLVFAMKISRKLSLEEYDIFCKKSLVKKIPKWFNRDVRLRLGDCIYDYGDKNELPTLRKGVHTIENMKRDLGGKHSLLSKHFYYFGQEPRQIPQYLKHIIKRGRKHLVNDDEVTIKKFENWISRFSKNKLYAKPQLQFEFEVEPSDGQISKCSVWHLRD
jgi:hypothetical protein